jgi:hypothetical protein
MKLAGGCWIYVRDYSQKQGTGRLVINTAYSMRILGYAVL